MIRLIASDLDGTLFLPDRTLSRQTVKAVRAALDAGIRFFAATGRSYEAADRLVRKEIPEAGLLTLDGAQLWVGDTLTISHMLTTEDCCEIYNVLKDFPVYMKFNGPHECFGVGTMDGLRADYGRFIARLRRHNDISRVEDDTYFQDLMAGLQAVKRPEDIPAVGKVYCFTNELDRIPEMVQALKEKTDFNVVSSGPENFEVTSKRASKGPVLKEYIESIGLRPEEVQVFGDSLNDLSMMQQGFHSMAMANANPIIKEAAEETGLSNIEDGVAIKIREILKKRG